MVQKVPREYLPISRLSGKRMQKEKKSLLKKPHGKLFLCRESSFREQGDNKIGALRLRIQRVLLIIDTVPEYSLESLGN